MVAQGHLIRSQIEGSSPIACSGQRFGCLREKTQGSSCAMPPARPMQLGITDFMRGASLCVEKVHHHRLFSSPVSSAQSLGDERRKTLVGGMVVVGEKGSTLAKRHRRQSSCEGFHTDQASPAIRRGD